MLTEITKLKNFGIFTDFTWLPELPQFKKRNLIYGWNYSGKTTLSKLFTNFDRSDNGHFSQAEYTIKCSTREDNFTHLDIEDIPLRAKVFNSHYVSQAFVWSEFDDDNNHIPTIRFYLGEKAASIEPQIDRCYRNINIYSSYKDKYKDEVKVFNEYDKDGGKFAQQATIIRKFLNEKLPPHKFNKGHLKKIVDDFKQPINVHILPDEQKASLIQRAIEDNTYNKIDFNINLSVSLKKIYNAVKNILEDTAPESLPFPFLSENTELFDWVQTGLHLHTEADNCHFCNSEINHQRISDLNTYYSDRLKAIQEAIEGLSYIIEFQVEQLKIDFPHESELAKHLKDNYNKAIRLYNRKKVDFVKELNKLNNDLLRKRESFFNPIKPSEVEIITLGFELYNITEIINEHNKYVDEFQKNKELAQEQILSHYVAEYLIDEDYFVKEQRNALVNILLVKVTKGVDSHFEKINELQAQLKDTVKGQEELNYYLSIFLNKNDIKITIEDDKFSLKRGDANATNLSEGEKTAITFSYFLTELKSMRIEGTLNRTIVYIDDPISSLDSNHIFQVRSLLQHFFKEDDYLQLFISTHNFEFFSVLNDSTLFGDRVKANLKSFYNIVRTPSGSRLIESPQHLRKYKSEYVHLFHIIKDYNAMENKHECIYLLLLPNALRRFLELYTLMKYPGNGELDRRMEIVFSPADGIFHNTKLYHWFSHEQQFEKIMQHDAKIDIINEAIDEVLIHLKSDTTHWAGLTGETI